MNIHQITFNTRIKHNLPKCGSYIVCTHYWFEFKTCKIQYFIGKCFKVKRKGTLSSVRMRSLCYKTIMEVLLFINTPTLIFAFCFVRDDIHKRMSFIFMRKTRKSISTS